MRIRKFWEAVDGNRRQSSAVGRLQSIAIDCVRSLAGVCGRLLSIFLACSALADDAWVATEDPLTGTVCVEGSVSADTRLDNRALSRTVHALVHGTEMKSESPETPAAVWDTTQESEGWHEFTDGSNVVKTLVRNDPSIAVEGGRLQSDVTWTADKVHIVRHKVLVPSGYRLTVEEGAVVKFGEGTGIEVLSGGKLTLSGRPDKRTCLTSIADDIYGGDTDCLATNGVYGTWSISSSDSTALDSYYTHIRFGTVSVLPTVGMAASYTTGLRSEGKVRINVSVSGSRSNRFSLHWRIKEGTAKFGEDYLQSEGEVEWPNTSGSGYYFEIPIAEKTSSEEIKHFTVEIFSTEDCNVNSGSLRTEVALTPQTDMPAIVCAESAVSDPVRLENRGEGTAGKALSHGTEWKSSDGETRAVAWNTTAESDGWKEYFDGSNTVKALVRNDASIAIEGGRLQANATWSSGQVHVVRQRVIVPSGVTLTISTNTVVKFCENTGITVNSGGQLVMAGSTNEPAVFTSIADDTIGGDTDLRVCVPTNDLYTLSISGTYSSAAGVKFRYTTFSSMPTVSIAGQAEASESDEVVRIPVSLSGSRSAPFLVRWRAIDDTAEYGTDFTQNEGLVSWQTSSDGAKYIVIPLVNDGIAEETERFTVELYDAQDANVSRSACRCTVIVRDSTQTHVPVAVCVESEISAPIRLENRAEGTLGKALAHGLELKSADGETRAELWDTTQEDDGWKTFGEGSNAVQVLVRNDPSIAVEGGRLQSNETWTAEAVHLVRNTVIVPSGVTLTVMTNTVVKFCEKTGITVNSGGKLVVLAATNAPAVFASVADDTVGSDTDLREASPVDGSYTISMSGTYSSPEGAVFRHTTFSTLPTVSITSGVEVNESDEQVKVAISVSGSRTAPFRLHWRAVDGTAKHGSDFTLQQGVVDWSSSSDSTKYIVIPIANDGEPEETERFVIELYEAQNANISRSAYRCTVTIRDSTPTEIPVAVCAESEISAPIRLENRAEGTLAKALVHGSEWKSAGGETRAILWDTTQEEDGWKTFGEGSNAVQVLVRNDPSIAVEGGRLQSNETWTASQTHLVRNWVIVPSGVTLTITTNAVVKFCELTGIQVNSGGRLDILGNLDENVMFTTAADDTAGGDVDMRTVAPSNGWYSISNSGTLYDEGLVSRYYALGSLPNVSLTSDLVVDAEEGIVRLPVYVSGSRTRTFSMDWTTSLGESGRIVWNSASEGTKWLTFPVTLDTPDFTFNLVKGCGCNISTPKVTYVNLYSNVVKRAVCTGSEISAPVRLETRDIATSYAAPLVTGIQQISGEDGTGHVDWNTSDREDGWQTVDCGGQAAELWVVNDPSMAVEGGRVQSNAVWSVDQVHLVRHWVIVPSGVTLTIPAGTVVKFCDQTGIKVESGGRLDCAGTATADVIFTSVHDDAVGGDTDGKDIEPKSGYYTISSSGTFTDTYTAMRYGTSGTFGSASIASQVIGKKQSGHVRIPVTISTSRSTAFAVDWVAVDGTAKFGEDYLCASGRVEWASSSGGTKYIDMPLERMTAKSTNETFTIRLTCGRGINLGTTTCQVKLYDTIGDVLTGSNVGFADSEWADLVPVDSAAGNEPLFVFGEVPVRYSTLWEANGARVRVTSTDMDEARSTLYVSDTAAEGWCPWQSGSYADGRYELAHVIADVAGEVVSSHGSVFIVNRDVRVHGGSLLADEVWTKDYVHYVRSTVTVQPGVTLTIEPGAVVKFRSGAGIVVANGGTAVGKGAVFTHASDDTVGGDTFFDGQDFEPLDGKYTLTGNWILDAATQRRYQSAVTVGGTISTNTIWKGHQTYKVTSSITVAAGATLDIEEGAIIKVNSSSDNVLSITVNSNATLNAVGTADAPVIFTTIKDDIHGDTNGDGTNTVASAGDWPRIYANGNVNLEHCHLRYCNQSSGRGAIEGICGKVIFNNSVIMESAADCVKMTGGSFVAHNSVFREAAAAFGGTSGAEIIVNNCLVAKCPVACRGVGKTFNNTIFIDCGAFFETNGNVCAGCVFYNPDGVGAQEDAVPWGGVWADPLLADYANGDYSLDGESPCIDAGVNVFTTTLLDLLGNDRVVNGVIDIGPCEFDSHVNTRSMVRFDLGLYGTRTGGGELVQTVTNGCAAVAPAFSVADGWSFVDWDSDFSCVTNNMTVTAQWARVPKTVTVETTLGVAPQGGTNTVFWGDTFSVQAPDPVVCGTTQYVCRGASNYQPLATHYDIRVTNDIAVVWNVWATNYWLAIEGAAEGVGEITGGTNGWKAAGSTVSLVAKPVNGVFFMGWAGDTNDCAVTGSSIVVAMDRPRDVRAVFARLSVDLTSAVEKMPYSGRIRVEGRDHALNCGVGEELKTRAYIVQREGATFASSGGTAQGLTGDDQYGTCTLPFAFPFYGKTYTRVYPNSNGAIFLDAGNTAYSNWDGKFMDHPMIAGLWRDMKSGEVYVTQTSESVTFRWNSTYYSGGGAVRFSVTLYKTGEIRCAYGSGNASGGIIGISAGDGENCLLHYDGSGSYGGVQDVRFIPCGVLPDWLTLTPDGVVGGTPTVAGTYQFHVYVADDDGHSTVLPVTIVVEENANKRPVVQGRIPSAAATRVFAGTNATYTVVAADPNGDALSYIWTLDGVVQKTVTTSNYVFAASFATHGSHTLSCAVTDGLWTMDAGSWRIESNCSLYVDAENGDDAQTGASEALAKRTLQAVVNAAIDGDSIFAAAGTYESVNTSNKSIRVTAVKDHERTIIDGGGTNRCVYVGYEGSYNESIQYTNTQFVGFTMKNGFVNGAGAGVGGGWYENCVVDGCAVGEGWNGGGAYYAWLFNCVLRNNRGKIGGGAQACKLFNCTVVGNTAVERGGGVGYSTVVNSIVWGNDAPTDVNYYDGALTYTCADPLPSGTGNICENPRFTDAEGGDYRLRQYSPCLDVGNNAAVVGECDLSGTNRIVNGRVDLGAYEGWVYLPAPPEVGGLEAEMDRRIGIVRLKWAAEEFARSYKIYRATTNDVETAAEIGATTDCFFDDETADPETDYWYWVAAANPTGVGPKGTSAKGRCLGAMTFGGSELASGTVGLAYRAKLEVSGGSGKYTWTSGADDYDILRSESSFLMDIDEPTGEVFGDDVCKAYPLPFDFPFYGKTYNKLWISSNGTLTFDGEYSAYSPSVEALKGRVMIAPFWKDLLQGNGGVYVSENGDESVTFIWYECAYYSGNTRVNASATLFADGTVLCSYGEGNASGAFVGVSAGDGERYRCYDWLNQSLDNADDVVFMPQDVPAGLTLEADGTLSGKPTVPGSYVFTVFVLDDLGNGTTQQVTLEIAENPDLRSVEFDLGEKGIRGGGGELVQYLMPGDSAVPPSVRVQSGWVFDGWDGSYSNITDNVTVAARYRTSYPDLHVDSVAVPSTVAAGEELTVAWMVGNTGNPAFTGTMDERVLLVSATNAADVRVAMAVKFEGAIARDGVVERSATFKVPLKGWDGRWIVCIETGGNPSMREAGGENALEAGHELEIKPVPLPNLVADAVSVDAALEPGMSISVTYREKNEGASVAKAPWTDEIYLESADTGASVRLGTVAREENLVADGMVSVAASFVLPEQIALAGRVKARVVVDAEEAVVESDESNEFVGADVLSLGTNLYFSVASDSVKENVTSGVRFTVKRSGPTTEPMTVQLSADAAGQVTMPETVTIPAGNASTIFTVKPIDNNVVEGSRTVEITAASGSCRSAVAELTILDDEVPKLSLALDRATLREGAGKIVATVTRELVADEPLTVYLSGVSTSRCNYPSSVTIPAGEKSVTFEIVATNDDVARVTDNVTLKVSASGHAATSVTYEVEDDDIPGVTLALTPEEVSEGAGAQAIYATLMRSDTNQIKRAVTVKLAASTANQLILPSSVTIPAYTMGVRFAIGVVDNNDDDGDREVAIDGAILIESCGCSGQPSNGDVIGGAVRINDNDRPALSLRAEPTTMREGLENAGALVLSHNSTLTEDLVVSLSYDLEGEIEIPFEVTIPAGEKRVRIPVRTLDDGMDDGGKLVSIYADDGSGMFSSGSTWIQVSDQNLPDLKVASVIPSAPSVVAMNPVQVTFAITNTGFFASRAPIPYAIHLVKGSSSSLTSGTVVATGSTEVGLEVGDSVTLTRELAAPEMPGNYRFAVVVNPDDVIRELDSANNTAWSDSLVVSVAYTATVAPERTVYHQGESVLLSGTAVKADGATPAAREKVEVNVWVNGMFRQLYATTDSSGAFSVVFTPLANESGRYTVSACYPGLRSSNAQGTFDILGMKYAGSSYLTWNMVVGSESTLKAEIRNLSGTPLTGLAVAIEGAPDNCELTTQLGDEIAGHGTASLSIKAKALEESATHAYAYFNVVVTCSEGLSVHVPCAFYAYVPVVAPTPGTVVKAKPSLAVAPNSVDTTMTVGKDKYLTFTLTNNGNADSGKVTVLPPSLTWMRVFGGEIDNLAPGESATVTLMLSPTRADGLSLGGTIRGSVAISCANESGCSCRFALTPVSDEVGGLNLAVADEYTYYLDTRPFLSGATVKVSEYYSGRTVRSGTTGEDGRYLVDDLPEGAYRVTVSAAKHGSRTEVVEIEPGRTAGLTVFLQSEICTASWDVKKIEVEDSYEITLLLDYETQVPAPIIKATVSDVLPDLAEGESFAFNITLENLGFIRADDVHIQFPSIDGCVFSVPALTYSVNAKSSVTVPVVMTCEYGPGTSGPADGTVDVVRNPGGSGGGDGPGGDDPGSGSGDPGTPGGGGDPSGGGGSPRHPASDYNRGCAVTANVYYRFLCGPDYREYAVLYDYKLNRDCSPGRVIYEPVSSGGNSFNYWDPTGYRAPTLGTSGNSTLPSTSPYTPPQPALDRPSGVTYNRTGCDPYDAALANYLRTRRDVELVNNILETAFKFTRDAILDSLPGMSCVKFLANSGQLDIGEVRNWSILDGYFTLYKDRRSNVEGVIDSAFDLVSCLQPVAGAIETRLARMSPNAFRGAIQGLRLFNSDAMEFISNVNELKNKGEDIYSNIIRPYLDANDEIARLELNVAETVARNHLDLEVALQMADGLMEEMDMVLGRENADLSMAESSEIMAHLFDSVDPANGCEASGGNGWEGMPISQDDYDKLVRRWNDSVKEYLDNGRTLENGVDFNKLASVRLRMAAGMAYVEKRGYADVVDMMAAALNAIKIRHEGASGDVCASVGFRLSQKVSMTREAFEGTLTLHNGHSSEPMKNIKLAVSVTDAEGNVCNGLFGITDGTLQGMTGTSLQTAGDGRLESGRDGTATIVFVPTPNAAPSEPKVYYFGANLSYTDPFTGDTVKIDLTPVALTVNPCPYLHFDYFVQRDVYGDDPFTADVVEPSAPAELAVMIRNGGAADAQGVWISSVKPECIKNTKGLLVDFDMKDHALDAMTLNGAAAHLGLNDVSIGTIQAGQCAIAQWWLTAGVEGHFIGMKATATQLNSWGNPDTSLVDPNVGVHKLVRSVVADDDDLPDFLTSEGNDYYGTPDAIYMSKGEVEPVRNDAIPGSVESAIGQNPVLQIPLVFKGTGWNYAYVPVAGISRYDIVSISRGDGSEVPLRNVWTTDRIFRDGQEPLREERLHVLDEIATAGSARYVVTLAAKPSDFPEVAQFEGLDGSVENVVRSSLAVVFSKKIDPSTFTADDITLVFNGERIHGLDELTITQDGGDGRRYVLAGLESICSAHGRYELTVQCAGIADLGGQLGVEGKSVAWIYTDAASPYFVAVEGAPAGRVNTMDSLVVVLSSEVTAESMATARITLNGMDVTGRLGISAVDAGGTRFALDGLDELQEADGDYELVVNGEDLRSVEGLPGVDSLVARWTRDTVAPVLESVERDNSLGGVRIVLKFSEAVDPSTLSLGAASLVHSPVVSSSTPQSLLDGAGIEDLGNGTYAITGLGEATSSDGVYTFAFDASRVADEAGNFATGSRTISWIVDTTPPARPTELGVSSEYGSVDTVVQTSEGSMTVSGVASEPGVVVQIFSRFLGGDEALLATPAVAGDGSFSAEVTLPESGGNLTLVVRLTDAAGNSSETEIRTYYDRIALVAELSGAPEIGVAADEVSLAFSDAVTVEDVTLAKFALTRNGDAVALEGATLTANADGKTFTLGGLSPLCSEDGDYVLSFAAADVHKHSSGLRASACAPLAWRYECPDREPPAVVEVRINGEVARGVYTNGVGTVEVTFSEDVNIRELASNGLIAQVLKIQLLDAGSRVTGTVRAVQSAVACEANGVRWTLPAGAVGTGHARLVVDSGLVADKAGNMLVPGDGATVAGLQGFNFESDLVAAVDSYAMPTWYDFDGDGIGDLVVGEKTAAGAGKVRVCRNVGTATEPRFSGFTYLKVGDVDLSIPASGCQGAQVAFGDLTGDGCDDLIVGHANGKVQLWRGTATRGVYGETEVLLTGAEPTYGSDRAFVCPCDLDGDGGLELLVGGMDGRFRLLKRNTEGEWSESWLADATGMPLKVAAGRSTPVLADVNADGCVDILTGDTDGNVWAFLGDGSAWNPTAISVFDNVTAKLSDRSRIGFADVDGDGVGDLLVGRACGSVELAPGLGTDSPAFAFRVKGIYTVTFDLGGLGSLKSGELVQRVVEDDPAVAPEVAVDDCYIFDGWDTAFDSIVDDVVVRARYTHKPPVNLTVAGVIAGAEAVASHRNGEYEIVYGDEVAVSVPKTVTNLSESVMACAGWTGSGSIPSAGNAESVVVRMTGDSSIIWAWEASKWWLELAAQNGTLSVASGWQEADSAVQVTATPNEHYVFKQWRGDLDGCMVDGATAVLAVDRKRAVAAEFELATHKVAFGGGLETTVPPAGEYDYAYGSMVTVTVVNAVQCSGATQFVCKGWSAVNAEPAGGEGTQAVFKVVGDVDLSWLWQTNVLTLAESVNAPGLVLTTGGASDWTPEWRKDASDGEHGAYVRNVGNHTNAWMQTTVEGPGTLAFSWQCDLASRNTKLQFFVDDVAQGVVSGSTSWTPVSVTVYGEGSHTLKWRLFTGRSGAAATDVGAVDAVVWSPAVPPTLAEALNTNLVWVTEGESSWRGVAKEAKLDARDAWAAVAGLGDDAEATIETRVYGTGFLMFDWAVSCETEYDWLEVSVDGEVRTYVTGDIGWLTEGLEIEGAKWHVVRWTYVKDELDDPEMAGDNKAMLDNVVWTSNDVAPDRTETTPVPVPHSVLEGAGFKFYLEAARWDYEKAAFMKGENGYSIWESYVAGLNPGAWDSTLKADIKVENGEVVVTWDPDLNENGAKHVRIYRTFGRKRLDGDEPWVDMQTVPEAEKGGYHFFKVTVEMPR